MKFRTSLAAYSAPAIVGAYALETSLQEAEAVLLASYFRDGMSLLDLGVGAGRTTGVLISRCSRYVGLDVSEAMIARSHGKFPRALLVVADAARVPLRPGVKFDCILFSFNGLGTFRYDGARHGCLADCARILSDSGVLLLSLHNSRFLVTTPRFDGVGLTKAMWRVLYAAFQTARHVPRRLLTRAFWHGRGYTVDPALHGGLTVYASTPAQFEAELRAHGFSVQRVVSAPFVSRRGTFLVPWYYYACSKTGTAPSR